MFTAENINAIDVDKLKEIVALKERMEDRAAAREFAIAKAAFQSECPPIHKNRETPKTSDRGSKFNFRWADLTRIADTIRETLTKHGLSYSFDTSEEGKTMVVRCKLSHVGGHSETSTMAMPIGSTLPISDQQKVGATSTYAMRYALVQALGLTTADEDSDGAPLGSPTGPITEDQVGELEAAVKDCGIDRQKVLAAYGVQTFDDLPAGRFREALKRCAEYKARKRAKS